MGSSIALQLISEAAQKGRFKRHIDATSSDPAQLVAIVTTQIERQLLTTSFNVSACGSGPMWRRGYTQRRAYAGAVDC
jgi:hypothetical protein